MKCYGSTAVSKTASPGSTPGTLATGPSRETTINPDLEEALAVGRAARDLLETEAYLTAMRAQEAFHIAAMVSAPEGSKGTDAREHSARMLHAYRELHSELEARASAATEIEKLLAEQTDEDPEDEI